MRVSVKHMVWLTLLLYLLSGFGSALGAFWCLSDQAGCGPGLASALRCAAHTGVTAAPAVADSRLATARCGPCLDVELRFPTVKSWVRPLRVPVAHPPVLPASRVADALPISLSALGRVGLAVSGPLLAQRHLRTVVLLN